MEIVGFFLVAPLIAAIHAEVLGTAFNFGRSKWEIRRDYPFSQRYLASLSILVFGFVMMLVASFASEVFAGSSSSQVAPTFSQEGLEEPNLTDALFNLGGMGVGVLVAAWAIPFYLKASHLAPLSPMDDARVYLKSLMLWFGALMVAVVPVVLVVLLISVWADL